jgi:spermidine/putrescine transport system ATP-binding protein
MTMGGSRHPDVELIGVSRRFGAHVAVDDISFAVSPGSFFSLLGPSGCGKSTTLRMISGLELPDSGTLRIAGQDMRGVPANRRPTNMVFQRWALFPHMTVFDNVAFGLVVDRVPKPELRTRVGEALELVGLAAYAARMPRQLSGGQMQRVALARALVKRPRVLLLDEPLGALDLKMRAQLQIELKRIQREVGATFIYVTHDQGEAMTMSDRIAVMDRGRIDQIGTPQQIYDDPATQFVATFIGNTNLLPVQVEAVTGATARVRLGPHVFSASFAGSAPSGAAAEISIRYERLRIGEAARAMPHRAAGTVREVIFSGSAVQYAVILAPSGPQLMVETAYDGIHALIPTGTDVDVGWEPSSVRLFAAT